MRILLAWSVAKMINTFASPALLLSKLGVADPSTRTVLTVLQRSKATSRA